MNTLANLKKLVFIAYNNTPAEVARKAGLSDHLVSKAEGYTDLLRFLVVLDNANTAQVANWLDSLGDNLDAI